MAENFSINYKEAIANKKFLPYFILIVIGILIIAVLIYFISPKIWQKAAEKPPLTPQKTLEDTLRELTAPENGKIEISKKVLDSLTAPGKGGRVSEDVLENLTAPNK
jgi:uncharacterized protein YneF (UPF0154 family)